LGNSTYGSDEYRESLRSIKPSIKKHYQRNSHHPEYHTVGTYTLGINGMNLKDIIEMWCDWQAAVRRHKDGKLESSIENNKKRFEMSEQLTQIFYNELH